MPRLFAICPRCALFVCLSVTAGVYAEEDIRDLKLKDWQPRSMLVTKATVVETPRYPVIDIHNHLGGGREYLTPERVARYLAEMDSAGVRTVVNLDGGSGDRLRETLAALDEAHPGRFLTFALVDFDGIDEEGWTDREVKRLEESFKAGAKGLKFHKSLGLRYRYKTGRLVPVDDPKLDPLWALCGKLGKPVVIHVADPAAFFTPLDRFNERWHELNQHPDWLFFGDQFPRRQEILDQLHRVIARHPGTTFISTHMGNNAEDLASVGESLDRFPNMLVDFDARISELGRQPYSARRFFLKYQDRILFGTDTTPRREAFRIYYRFLETDDEYFDCSASHHLQGFWMIYGIFLPDDVLEKIYHKNAERVLGLSDAIKTSQRSLAPAGLVSLAAQAALTAAPNGTPELKVPRTKDFTVTGDGSNKAWNGAVWQTMTRKKADGHSYESKFKVLYSDTGIYVLFDGADARLTATHQADGKNLWEEDVFEFFFWPDERQPMYFEYEVSPLGFELQLLMWKHDKKMYRWQPWTSVDRKDQLDRAVRKVTATRGGKQQSGAKISGWTAEMFVPFSALQPMQNVPAKPKTRWRANFYRVDHDDKKSNSWYWSKVDKNFHTLEQFGTLVFE